MAADLFPLRILHLVAADVEVAVGEEGRHLAEKAVEHLVGLFARGVERGFEDTPSPLNLVGPGRARQLRHADQPARGVARDIELGDHADAAIARVLHHFADLACV